MKIYIASDHAGFELKGKLVPFIESKGHEVEDMGPHELDKGDDYPDFVSPLAERVASESGSMGVVLGGSGQGEAMDANKVEGIRCALWYGGDMDIIKLSRLHNDANILSLGARFISLEETEEAVDIWLDTDFSEAERHIRRIKKI